MIQSNTKKKNKKGEEKKGGTITIYNRGKKGHGNASGTQGGSGPFREVKRLTSFTASFAISIGK